MEGKGREGKEGGVRRSPRRCRRKRLFWRAAKGVPRKPQDVRCQIRVMAFLFQRPFVLGIRRYSQGAGGPVPYLPAQAEKPILTLPLPLMDRSCLSRVCSYIAWTHEFPGSDAEWE